MSEIDFEYGRIIGEKLRAARQQRHITLRELAERAELGFPPAVRMASVTGGPEEVAAFVGAAGLPDRAEILGPIPLEGAGRDRPPEASRALIRIGRGDGLELARALHAVQATRSARKDGGAIRVQLDPAEVA